MTDTPRPERPHILLITADQWRYDAAGFSGSSYVRTPHLDRLAERGIIFDAAYTSCPMCVPARASLISGRYGHEYDWRPAPEWGAEDEPTIPRLLNGAGYHTAAAGKMHFMPLRRSHGFQEMVLCEHGAPEYYNQDDYHPWLAAQGYDDIHELWQFPRNYHLASHEFRANLQARPSPLPEALYATTWIADRAIDLIRRHDPVQPLLMWLSFLKPHHAFDPPVPWDRFYDPDALPLPDRSLGAVERLPASARAALEARVLHNVFDLSSLDARLLRRVRAFYFATVSHLDHHVGRVLDALAERGMLDHTAVLATSDHGDFLGHRNRLFKDSGQGALLYEDLVRVPLFLTLPRSWGTSAPRGHWADPVQHVDLLPTIAELAGCAVPELPQPLPGASLLAQLQARSGRSAESQPDRWALCEAPNGRCAAVRAGRYKYIFDPRDSLQQLYDLAADPGERYNLAPEPAVARVIEELHARLPERYQG